MNRYPLLAAAVFLLGLSSMTAAQAAQGCEADAPGCLLERLAQLESPLQQMPDNLPTSSGYALQFDLPPVSLLPAGLDLPALLDEGSALQAPMGAFLEGLSVAGMLAAPADTALPPALESLEPAAVSLPDTLAEPASAALQPLTEELNRGLERLR